MYRIFFFSLFIGLAWSLRPARLSSRRSTAVRLTPDDPVVYAAQFDPLQFATAGSILTTFFFVQRQINRSNALLESLKVAKDELKKVRNEAISGTNDSEKISELGFTIKKLEQEWRDTATLRLPGIHNLLSTIHLDSYPINLVPYQSFSSLLRRIYSTLSRPTS